MLSTIAGIRAAAERHGYAPALVTGARIITYAELLGLVARISNALADRGLKPLAKIFINIADPDLRVITLIAAMHAGMIPFALMEIGELGDEVDYDFVVGASALQVPTPIADLVLGPGIFGAEGDGALRDFPDRRGEDILYVGNTTGTTGRRKLVAELFGAFETRGGAGREGASAATPLMQRMAAQDRVLFTPGDMTKLGVTLLLQIMADGATHVRALRDIGETLKMISAFAVSWIFTTPGKLGEFMDRMEAGGIRCPSVKRISITGSLFPRELVERIERNFNAEILVTYGASEVGRVSVGTITGASFQTGYVGDLCPEVKMISTGTPEQPALLTIVNDRVDYSPYYSKGRTIANQLRLFTLPDLGYLKGTKLFLVGRDDEVFNISGNKYPYSLIDNDLRQVPGVADVGIVDATPIGDLTGLVIAVAARTPVDIGALVARVCRIVRAPKAADHLHLFLVAEVPRNSLGKVDREAVVRAYRAADATR